MKTAFIAILIMTPVIAMATPNSTKHENNRTCDTVDFGGTWVSYGARRCEITLNTNGNIVDGKCSGKINGQPIVLPVGQDPLIVPLPLVQPSLSNGSSNVVLSNLFSFTNDHYDCEFTALVTQPIILKFASAGGTSIGIGISPGPVSANNIVSIPGGLGNNAVVRYNGIMSQDHDTMIMSFRGVANSGGKVVPMTYPIPLTPKHGWDGTVASFFGSNLHLDTDAITFTKVEFATK